MLQSAGIRARVAVAADAVAALVEAHHSVRRHAMPVTRDGTTTDRAVEAVSIAHPGGLAVQAKYGALTDAARAVGLDVNGKAE
ncbi:hypothetical protein AB0J27_20265 [Micromonospora chokoriensis]